jgi:hypothetical protein
VPPSASDRPVSRPSIGWLADGGLSGDCLHNAVSVRRHPSCKVLPCASCGRRGEAGDTTHAVHICLPSTDHLRDVPGRIQTLPIKLADIASPTFAHPTLGSEDSQGCRPTRCGERQALAGIRHPDGGVARLDLAVDMPLAWIEGRGTSGADSDLTLPQIVSLD